MAKAINREWVVEVIGDTGIWTHVVWAESPQLAGEEVLLLEQQRGVPGKIGRVTLAPPRPPDPSPELKWIEAKRALGR
jgi:hypothetical protein